MFCRFWSWRLQFLFCCIWELFCHDWVGWRWNMWWCHQHFGMSIRRRWLLLRRTCYKRVLLLHMSWIHYNYRSIQSPNYYHLLQRNSYYWNGIRLRWPTDNYYNFTYKEKHFWKFWKIPNELYFWTETDNTTIKDRTSWKLWEKQWLQLTKLFWFLFYLCAILFAL